MHLQSNYENDAVEQRLAALVTSSQQHVQPSPPARDQSLIAASTPAASGQKDCSHKLRDACQRVGDAHVSPSVASYGHQQHNMHSQEDVDAELCRSSGRTTAKRTDNAEPEGGRGTHMGEHACARPGSTPSRATVYHACNLAQYMGIAISLRQPEESYLHCTSHVWRYCSAFVPGASFYTQLNMESRYCSAPCVTLGPRSRFQAGIMMIAIGAQWHCRRCNTLLVVSWPCHPETACTLDATIMMMFNQLVNWRTLILALCVPVLVCSLVIQLASQQLHGLGV